MEFVELYKHVVLIDMACSLCIIYGDESDDVEGDEDFFLPTEISLNKKHLNVTGSPLKKFLWLICLSSKRLTCVIPVSLFTAGFGENLRRSHRRGNVVQ